MDQVASNGVSGRSGPSRVYSGANTLRARFKSDATAAVGSTVRLYGHPTKLEFGNVELHQPRPRWISRPSVLESEPSDSDGQHVPLNLLRSSSIHRIAVALAAHLSPGREGCAVWSHIPTTNRLITSPSSCSCCA
jgi:hypothetical protein